MGEQKTNQELSTDANAIQIIGEATMEGNFGEILVKVLLRNIVLTVFKYTSGHTFIWTYENVIPGERYTVSVEATAWDQSKSVEEIIEVAPSQPFLLDTMQDRFEKFYFTFTNKGFGLNFVSEILCTGYSVKETEPFSRTKLVSASSQHIGCILRVGVISYTKGSYFEMGILVGFVTNVKATAEPVCRLHITGDVKGKGSENRYTFDRF